MKNHKFELGDKKLCKVCGKSLQNCQSWVQCWLIQGLTHFRKAEIGEEKLRIVTDIGQSNMFEPIQELTVKVNYVENTKLSSYILTPEGQLLSKQIESPNLKIVKELSRVVVVSVACGEDHVLVLEAGMYLWSWGSNSHGQLGKQSTEPGPVSEVNQVVRITAGPQFSVAVGIEGEVYLWGDNSRNQLGTLETSSKLQSPSCASVQPWKKSQSTSRNYFRSNIERQVQIGGMSTDQIKRRRLENEDLLGRIADSRKKEVALREEVSGGGFRKFREVWQEDSLIKELEELISTVEGLNKKVSDEVESKKAEKAQTKQKIDLLREEISNLKTEVFETLEEVKHHNSSSDFVEKQKELHSKATYKERLIETKKKEVLEATESLKSIKGSICSLKEQCDNKIETYKQMKSVRKKYLAEELLQKQKSTLVGELEKLQKANEAIAQTSPWNLGKLVQAEPNEVFELSELLLKKIEEEVEGYLSLINRQGIECVYGLWLIVQENVELHLKRSYLSKVLCEKTNKKLKNKQEESLEATLNSVLQKGGFSSRVVLKRNPKKKIPEKPAANRTQESGTKRRGCFG